MVAGANYSAGALKKLVFGNAYRDIWTLSIQVELLDLAREAGGIEPLRRVGGLQTAGLALRGADGRSYTFRGVAKDPTLILPEEAPGHADRRYRSGPDLGKFPRRLASRRAVGARRRRAAVVAAARRHAR